MNIASLAPALLLAAAAAWAQPKPIELRYASGAPPKGNPWVMQTERFARAVHEESGGELRIQPFFASQLGSEQDTVQQVARGRIDMGGYSGGAAALIVPEIALLLMPFYFRNTAEADCVIDQHITPRVGEAFAKKGVHFVGWTSIGSIELFGRKPHVTPADLKGAKAAIYANKTQALFFTSLGASVNPLGLPEWIPAFQTGMAEVVLSAVTYSLPSGLTKVAPVVSRVNAYDAPGLMLMNKGVWERLSKPQQQALDRAAARFTAAQYRDEVRGFEATLYGQLEQAGGGVIDATPQQRELWRKAMEPVYPRIVEETGGDSAAFYAAMEAGRKACAR